MLTLRKEKSFQVFLLNFVKIFAKNHPNLGNFYTKVIRIWTKNIPIWIFGSFLYKFCWNNHTKHFGMNQFANLVIKWMDFRPYLHPTFLWGAPMNLLVTFYASWICLNLQHTKCVCSFVCLFVITNITREVLLVEIGAWSLVGILPVIIIKSD